MAERPLIVFDVNETLLDLETMNPIFERIFHDRSAMRLWFANLILYSCALTVANVYVPFTEIGGAVMQMLARSRGLEITDADKAELTRQFASMPPHPEVPAALRKLRAAGFRLFTLTDNLLEIQGRQWNLQQTQLLTGNLEAKVCTVSDSSLDSKTQDRSINAYSTIKNPKKFISTKVPYWR